MYISLNDSTLFIKQCVAVVYFFFYTKLHVVGKHILIVHMNNLDCQLVYNKINRSLKYNHASTLRELH